MRGRIHGDVVGIELLLVGQRVEVGFDGEGNDSRRAVSEVLFEGFRVYARRHVEWR